MQVNVFMHGGIFCCILSVDAVFVIGMFQFVLGNKEGEFELDTAETPHFQTVLIALRPNFGCFLLPSCFRLDVLPSCSS